MPENEIKYPATVIVHWATGPVPCCQNHANQLIGLGKFMGGHTVVTEGTDPDAECENCINEDK